MNKKTVLIVLAQGFEEIEAFTPMDVLRRLGYHVCLVGLDGITVQGAHGLSVNADLVFNDADFSAADAIVLPGGLPGATNLRDHKELRKNLQIAAAEHRITAAICAAPIVLQDAGLLDSVVCTGYPGSEKLAEKPGLRYSGAMVERQGSVITAKGPGAAFLFARETALALGCSADEFQKLAEGMMVQL